MKTKITIASRGSELALWQANWLKYRLESLRPETKFDLKVIKTHGDKMIHTPLHNIEGKGFFTKAIEDALLDESCDIAVHSLKDLPTKLPAGLKIAAVSEREDPHDVLISRNANPLDELPQGATVAAGSMRRRSQLLNYRKDLKIADIRGNILTRIKKFKESNWDGMILAHAGLKRLNLENNISQIIPENIMLPAVCQGIMAVESREKDMELNELLNSLNNEKTFSQAVAERSLLRTVEGGCQIPVGVYTVITNGKIKLNAMLGSADGDKILRCTVEGNISEAEGIGTEAGNFLLNSGGREILNELRPEL